MTEITDVNLALFQLQADIINVARNINSGRISPSDIHVVRLGVDPVCVGMAVMDQDVFEG